MLTPYTNEVHILRHSFRAPDGRLSTEGKKVAFQKGQEYASLIPNAIVDILGSPLGKEGSIEQALNGGTFYPGRALETGLLFAGGLGVEGITLAPDERLAYHLTAEDQTLMTRLSIQGMSNFDIMIDYLLPSMYTDALHVADLVTNKVTTPFSNRNSFVFGFGHDATAWLLAYAVTKGDRALVNAPVSEMTGIHFVRENGSSEMNVSLDYLGSKSPAPIVIPVQELTQRVHEYLKP